MKQRLIHRPTLFNGSEDRLRFEASFCRPVSASEPMAKQVLE